MGHPHDLEYMKMLKAMPKKVLKRREIVCKDKDLEKASQKQGKVHFSLCVWNLSEYSKSSGLGDEAASMIHVFYESKDERKVLNAFASAGIDLESSEAVPVEPDSSVPHEQNIMYTKENLHLQDMYSWEEGPSLPASDLKSRFKMK